MTIAASLDSAEFLDQVSQALPDGRRETMLHIENMHCGACVKRISAAMTDLGAEVQADVPSASALLRWAPAQQALSVLLSKLNALGFNATTLADDGHYRSLRGQQRQALTRLGIALLFGMQVMMLASGEYLGEVDPSMLPLLRYAQWLLVTPVALYAGWPFLSQGFAALRSGRLNMDTPVALAMSTAYGFSAWNTLTHQGHVYFDSVAMFVFLLSIARYAQDRGHMLAADRLRRLSACAPLTAHRQDADGLHEIPAGQLVKNDVLVVAPGAVLPADGLLLDDAEVDESLLSGESLPLHRTAGSTVLAGSINLGDQSLRLQVTCTGPQTQLSQIARLVQKAQTQRPAYAGLSEWVARYFVALVLCLAVGTAVYWRNDPDQAMAALLAVLVVTCPCALSLAVPTTLAAAMTRLGRAGVLLVNASALLKLNQIGHVCIDKTGTLTTRQLHIAEVIAETPALADQSRRIAASLEAGLAHPIALAFADTQSSHVAIDRKVVPGVGVSGIVDDQPYQLMATAAPQDSDPGLRWFVLRQKNGDPLAHFGLQETLRQGVQQMIRDFQNRGLTVHLLSGDQSGNATRLGRQLGADHSLEAQLPEDKLAYLQKLQAQGQRVLAVGDGSNDGPLLAAADVSVGLVSGTAIAQSAGDMLLTQDDLKGLLHTLDTGLSAQRIIRQNFAWALLYNLTMVPIAMAGLITPWVAALGMGISSLFVTLNALRVLQVAATRKPAQQESAA